MGGERTSRRGCGGVVRPAEVNCPLLTNHCKSAQEFMSSSGDVPEIRCACPPLLHPTGPSVHMKSHMAAARGPKERVSQGRTSTGHLPLCAASQFRSGPCLDSWRKQN